MQKCTDAWKQKCKKYLQELPEKLDSSMHFCPELSNLRNPYKLAISPPTLYRILVECRNAQKHRNRNAERYLHKFPEMLDSSIHLFPGTSFSEIPINSQPAHQPCGISRECRNAQRHRNINAERYLQKFPGSFDSSMHLFPEISKIRNSYKLAASPPTPYKISMEYRNAQMHRSRNAERYLQEFPEKVNRSMHLFPELSVFRNPYKLAASPPTFYRISIGCRTAQKHRSRHAERYLQKIPENFDSSMHFFQKISLSEIPIAASPPTLYKTSIACRNAQKHRSRNPERYRQKFPGSFDNSMHFPEISKLRNSYELAASPPTPYRVPLECRITQIHWPPRGHPGAMQMPFRSHSGATRVPHKGHP